MNQTRQIDNPDSTLTTLFPLTHCVGIGNLTISFLLMFHALRTDHLDLRFVAHLFSRGTTRYKSTLCKLYQITYVLCAAGIMNRTAQVCDVVLFEQYFDFAVIPPQAPVLATPIRIESLLNHHMGCDNPHIHQRRKELYDLFVKSITGRTATLPDTDGIMGEESGDDQ
jgi:hypothetical protein